MDEETLTVQEQDSAAELARLARENEILRQNALAASRAPVRGVTGGGVMNTDRKDDFLAGLEEF